MGLTTITDENKSLGASVERNRSGAHGAPARAGICTCDAGKVARKWANGPLVVNPDCKRAFIILVRGRRGAKGRGTMRAGDAPLPMHFSTKTTTSTGCTIPRVYVKRNLFSACNYERSPHLYGALIRFSVLRNMYNEKRRNPRQQLLRYEKTFL